MDEVYDDLKVEVEEERDRRPRRYQFYKNVLRDYHTRGDGRIIFRYSTMSVPMNSGGRRRDFAFACLTRDRHFEHRLNVYFISDSYNINAALDVPTSRQVRARFVCQPLPSYCMPWLLAEEPAIAFGAPEYSAKILEYIYRQIRNPENVAASASDDPVCRLGRAKKLRICASAMNSSFFTDTIIFNPAPYLQSDECQLNEVSFQTYEARAHVSEPFLEWMLTCAVQLTNTSGNTPNAYYYVSRAYYSHHAIVYSRRSTTTGWNIENISGDISVIIDEKDETEENLSVNVADLLRVLRDSASTSGT